MLFVTLEHNMAFHAKSTSKIRPFRFHSHLKKYISAVYSELVAKRTWKNYNYL